MPPLKSDIAPTSDTPEKLKPYLSLGLDLDIGYKEATTECSFCRKENKFSISVESGLWRCWVCGEGSQRGGGNITTFMRRLWETSDESESAYEELAQERKLLYADTLAQWGACRSLLTGDWMLPGLNAAGKLVQLYHWRRDHKTGKRYLSATEGVGHGLYMPRLGVPNYAEIYVCEGPWDAMVLWELDSSLAIVAVPGCQVFSEAWLPLFAGKVVTFLYDNDHPREVNGRVQEGGGLVGTRRASRILLKADPPPSDIRWMKWGADGYDPTLPSGYDVRDWLCG